VDVPVYAIALFVFALLYLALSVFLGLALIITLFAVLIYLVTRYGKLPDDYPYGKGDTAVTIIFIGITWGIFSFLGPKNPIPFLGQGLTYAAPSFPLSSVVIIVIVVALVFLVAFALIGREGMGQQGEDEARPKQSIGS
jgi:hypothetical protein